MSGRSEWLLSLISSVEEIFDFTTSEFSLRLLLLDGRVSAAPFPLPSRTNNLPPTLLVFPRGRDEDANGLGVLFI